MKIYVLGKVGSGKTTLSNQLSNLTEIPVYHLDEICYDGDQRLSDEKSVRKFEQILMKENFIIEDAGRKRFEYGLQKVDKIIYIDLPQCFLYYRLIKRFVKQKLKLEKSTYKPSLQILCKLFTYLQDERLNRLRKNTNVIRLENKKEIKIFLEKVEKNGEIDSRIGKSW